MILMDLRRSITELPDDKALLLVEAARVNRQLDYPIMAHHRPEDVMMRKGEEEEQT